MILNTLHAAKLAVGKPRASGDDPAVADAAPRHRE